MTRVFNIAVLVLFVGILALGVNVAYDDAGVEHDVTNESITVDYAQNVSVDTDADEYGTDPTVRNSSGAVLEAGMDYTWDADAGSVSWQNTSSTTDGEEASISYTYTERTQATEVSWSVLRPFGAIVWVIPFAAVMFGLIRLSSLGGGRGGGL